MQAAAGATLATLMELVPDEERNSASFAEGLDEILSRLAREAVGQPHVVTDPRAAITSALAPILADRIVNQQASEAASEVWGKALTWNGRGRLDPTASGKVNRMLHVAVPSSETIRPTDWGAVVKFPDVWWRDDELRNRFGVTPDRLLEDEYKLEPGDREKCRRRLIRIAAACDYAQNRPGPDHLSVRARNSRNGKASPEASRVRVAFPDPGRRTGRRTVRPRRQRSLSTQRGPGRRQGMAARLPAPRAVADAPDFTCRQLLGASRNRAVVERRSGRPRQALKPPSSAARLPARHRNPVETARNHRQTPPPHLHPPMPVPALRCRGSRHRSPAPLFRPEP